MLRFAHMAFALRAPASFRIGAGPVCNIMLRFARMAFALCAPASFRINCL